MQDATFAAKILNYMLDLPNKVPLPVGKRNSDSLIATAFMWDEVYRIADKKRDEARAALKDVYDITTLPPGIHQGPTTSHFGITCEVTVPVKRFNGGALAEALKKKYKVPLPVTKEMIDASTLPTSSQRRLKIAERSD